MNIAEKYIEELKKAYYKNGGKEIWDNFEKLKEGASEEDIKKIAASFGSISNSKDIKQPLKTVLFNARPYYSENGNLLVLAVNEEFDKEWLDREENIELIKKVILEEVGVNVEIKAKFEKEAKQVGDVRITGFDKIAPELLIYED